MQLEDTCHYIIREGISSMKEEQHAIKVMYGNRNNPWIL